MYDSDRPSAIPTNAQMVAGYIDGSNPWSTADWARFPNAVKVRIARRSTTNDGHVLDVEPGIVPANQMVGWVRMRRKSGADPSIYCNQMNDWQNLRNLFHDANEPEPHWWVSRYRLINGQAPPIPNGTVAIQYADPAVHGEGHYDLSAVADYWPGVDTHSVTKETKMVDYILGRSTDNETVYVGNGVICRPVSDLQEMNDLVHIAQHSSEFEGKVNNPLGNMKVLGVDVRKLVRDAIVEVLPSALHDYFVANPPTVSVDAEAIATAVWNKARDNDTSTGPTS